MPDKFEIVVRSASTNDIESIVDFQLAMAIETESIFLEKEITSKGVSEVFADSSKGKYYVAETSNCVIGCMLTTPEWSDWRNRYILWIQSVYVRPEHRGNGVFKALYNHLLDHVNNDQGIGGIRLYVDKTNHQAQAVYNQLGMNGEHYKVFEWMK
jgi:L-amino acid N-acyltransferase YncA